MSYTKKVIFAFLLLLSLKTFGQTWEIINPLLLGGDTLLTHTAMNFIDKNKGWIITSGYITSTPGGNLKGQTRLYETKDGAHSWTLRLKDSTYNEVFSYCSYGSENIWFLGSTGKLYYSTNSGKDWNTSLISDNPPKPNGFVFTGIHFFSSSKGVAFDEFRWFTSDGGKTWSKGLDSTIIPRPKSVFFVNDSTGFIGSDYHPTILDAGYAAKTTNGGRSWSHDTRIMSLIYDVEFFDSLKGFAVGTNGSWKSGHIFKTVDGGNNWEFTTMQFNKPFWQIGFIDENTGWITGEGKIYRTNDGGSNWELKLDNIQSRLNQFIVLKKDKFAYILGDNLDGRFTLLKADLSNLTDIKNTESKLPHEFRLMDNYPNPFNPSTTIEYLIPVSCNVSLKIYDMLGKEVTTLVNENKSAGSHKVQFNASSLPSGIYIYNLHAGQYMASKKLMLLK